MSTSLISTMGVDSENATSSNTSSASAMSGIEFFDISQDFIECEKTLKNRLGDGQLGSTYKGKFKGQTDVAVKILRESNLTVQKSLQEEARMLHSLQHSGIITMIGVQGNQNPFSIIYELAMCSLYEALYTREEKHPLRITKDLYNRKAKVLADCCEAFAFLHDRKFVHGNIKSSNILFTQEGIVKLSGFGFLKTKHLIIGGQQKSNSFASPKSIISTNNNQSILTPYLAPELLIAKETSPRPFQSPTRPVIPLLNNSAEYSESTDVYAFGILMNEVFDHAPPFPGLTPQNIITRLKRTDNNRPLLFARQDDMWIDTTRRNIFRDLQSLIKHCWKNNSFDRPKFFDIAQKLDLMHSALTNPEILYLPAYDHSAKTESVESTATSITKAKPVKEYAIELPPRTASLDDSIIGPIPSGSMSKFNTSCNSYSYEDSSIQATTSRATIEMISKSSDAFDTPKKDTSDDAMLEETPMLEKEEFSSSLLEVEAPVAIKEEESVVIAFTTPSIHGEDSKIVETSVGECKLDFDEFEPTSPQTIAATETSPDISFRSKTSSVSGHSKKLTSKSASRASMEAKMQLVDIHHIELLFYQSSFCYNAEAKIQLLDYAIEGIVLAEGFLMIMLYQGNGTEKDIPQAVNLFKKVGSWLFETANIDTSTVNATASAVHYAQYILGICYEYGIGMNTPNFNEAVKYYILSSNYGYTSAQVNLGYCYKHGLGVEVNLDEAIKLFTIGANSHHVEAIYQLACILFHMPANEKDITQAVKLYDIGAKCHHIACINALGYCHEHGIGTAPNLPEAVRLYTIAANYGLAIAQYNLGYCYDHGLGTESKDPVKAVEYYRLSANQGHIDAQCHLAYCYEFGKGTDANILEAIKFYHLSASQGHSTAQNTLGEYYKQGKYVNMNITKAVEYFTLSANQHNPLAQNNLGYCYQHGQGVPQNHSQAIVFYTSAAEQGNAIAQNNLGYCFQHGLGIPVNYEQAAQWYRLSANQGYAAAQYNLGYCYANGLGVEVNLDEAFRLYTLSAQQGNPTAQQCLEYCYNSQWKAAGNNPTAGASSFSSSGASVTSSKSSTTNKMKSLLGWSSSNHSIAMQTNATPTTSSHGEEKSNHGVPGIRIPPPVNSSPNSSRQQQQQQPRMPATIQPSPTSAVNGVSNGPVSPRRTHQDAITGQGKPGNRTPNSSSTVASADSKKSTSSSKQTVFKIKSRFF